MFFVISGFLIITLLLRERTRTGGISLRHFYIRRFLRIFPPYYLMLFVVGVTAFLKPGNTSAGVRHDLLYAVFFVSNLVPMQSMLSITWSLAVEEQFYLLAPAVEKYLRRGLPVLLAAAYVLVSLPAFGLFPELELPAFFRESTFGPILLGVALAHALGNPRAFAWISRALGWKLAPVMALSLVVLAASHPADDISGWPRVAMHWSFLVLVASCVVREQNALRPVLSLWPIRRIGMVSYGMYLYHLVVMHFVAKMLTALSVSWRIHYFIATVLATAVAELSYRFYEARFLAMKARFGAQVSEAAPR
jgi:peptidoglycan/LPS O-acetylase OafA/YrhL